MDIAFYETGKPYLIIQRFGWVVVGRVRNIGALHLVLEDAGYIVNTGGVPWAELVSGKTSGTTDIRRIGNGVIRVGLPEVWAGECADSVLPSPSEKHSRGRATRS